MCVFKHADVTRPPAFLQFPVLTQTTTPTETTTVTASDELSSLYRKWAQHVSATQSQALVRLSALDPYTLDSTAVVSSFPPTAEFSLEQLIAKYQHTSVSEWHARFNYALSVFFNQQYSDARALCQILAQSAPEAIAADALQWLDWLNEFYSSPPVEAVLWKTHPTTTSLSALQPFSDTQQQPHQAAATLLTNIKDRETALHRDVESWRAKDKVLSMSAVLCFIVILAASTHKRVAVPRFIPSTTSIPTISFSASAPLPAFPHQNARSSSACQCLWPGPALA